MSIYKKGNIWHVYFIGANGERVRKSTGTSNKEKAQELHDKLKAQQWDEKKLSVKPPRIWQEAVVRYLNEQSEKKSLITDKYWLRWIDLHLRDVELHKINRVMLENIKAERLKMGVTNATTNRTLTTIRKILNVACKQWEWIDSVPSVKMLPEPKQRVRFLTHDEAQRLISELPDHTAAMVKFSLATGLRESNVTGLTWAQVDMQRRCAWIYAEQAKAGKSIAVPLNDDAMMTLRSQVGKHETHVFSYKGSLIAKANNSAFASGLKRAGIEDFRWHDLRHTWASWHVQSGTPLPVLKELGGWADFEMVLRYAHLSSEHLAQYANGSKISESSTFAPPLLKLVVVR